MNVTAHQEKGKIEETKMGKRRAGEERKRKQATDFEKAVCCPSAVVQGAARRKMKGSARGNWDPREGQQPFRSNPNGNRGPHHHVEEAVDWCRNKFRNKLSLYCLAL